MIHCCRRKSFAPVTAAQKILLYHSAAEHLLSGQKGRRITRRFVRLFLLLPPQAGRRGSESSERLLKNVGAWCTASRAPRRGSAPRLTARGAVLPARSCGSPRRAVPERPRLCPHAAPSRARRNPSCARGWPCPSRWPCSQPPLPRILKAKPRGQPVPAGAAEGALGSRLSPAAAAPTRPRSGFEEGSPRPLLGGRAVPRSTAPHSCPKRPQKKRPLRVTASATA